MGNSRTTPLAVSANMTSIKLACGHRIGVDSKSFHDAMASNRAVTFMGPQKMAPQGKEYPKLEDPKGRQIGRQGLL